MVTWRSTSLDMVQKVRLTALHVDRIGHIARRESPYWLRVESSTPVCFRVSVVKWLWIISCTHIFKCKRNLNTCARNCVPSASSNIMFLRVALWLWCTNCGKRPGRWRGGNRVDDEWRKDWTSYIATQFKYVREINVMWTECYVLHTSEY